MPSLQQSISSEDDHLSFMDGYVDEAGAKSALGRIK
jgi:hypothetical protein